MAGQQTFAKKTVVLSGANRGIGLSLAKAVLHRGAKLFAGARQPEAATELQALKQEFPETLRILPLDVTDDASVKNFAHHIDSTCVDILINNAGVNLNGDNKVVTLPVKILAETFDVNTLGPLRLIQALLEKLHRAPMPKVANISSVMGSIAENSSGGVPAYRASKSALNQLSHCLSIEDDKLIVLALHPGWVKTRMGGDSAPVSTQESAEGLLKVIEEASHKESGTFIRFNSERVAW